MIRPRTVFRSILSILLLWCALTFLYAALPFPRYADDGTNYATSVLSRGGTLTRVYEFDDFFPPSDSHPSIAQARECGRFRFALTFSVSSSTNTLAIGDSHTVSLVPSDGLFDGFSEPTIVAAPAGDMDGINPPWFDLTDATLLFYLIHSDLAALTLRTRWNEGALEVWPDASSWESRHGPPSNMKPLLSIKPAADDKSSLSASTPPPPLSSSPTKTYPLRRILLLIIAPTGILLLGLFAGLRYAIRIACDMLVVAFHIVSVLFILVGLVWLAMGRPPLGDLAGNLRDSGHEAWQGARSWVHRRRGRGGSIALPTVQEKDDRADRVVDEEKADIHVSNDVVGHKE